MLEIEMFADTANSSGSILYFNKYLFKFTLHHVIKSWNHFKVDATLYT